MPISEKANQIDEPEKIVEMGKGINGKYELITVIKTEDQPISRNNMMRDLPRWFPAMYEVIDGFVMGLGAIENFVMNIKRMNRKVRKNG